MNSLTVTPCREAAVSKSRFSCLVVRRFTRLVRRGLDAVLGMVVHTLYIQFWSLSRAFYRIVNRF